MGKAIFNMQDVLRIEADVIRQLPINRPLDSANYFKEDVAQFLYQAYLNDRTDTRILEYAFPLIELVIVKHLNLFRNSGMERAEIFNMLCIGAMKALDKYNSEKGRLFTYLTLITHYRVYDLNKTIMDNRQRAEVFVFDEELDTIQDYSAISELSDFLSFLQKLKETEGPTANRIIDALYDSITLNPAISSQGRDRIIELMAKHAKLPEIIIKAYYEKILKKYITHDLPY